MSREPDFVRAKRKINEATAWQGDVNVSLGDETVTFKHRLLDESEFLNLQRELDMEALSEEDGTEDDEIVVDAGEDGATTNMGQTEAQERLLELQQAEELSDEEERELRELTEQVAGQTDTIEDALGEDGYDLLMELGHEVIQPSDEDVEYVRGLFSEDPSTAQEMCGLTGMPESITTDEIRDHMTDELRDMVTGQPYPIKLNVGLQAMTETISVLGNGFQSGE